MLSTDCWDAVVPSGGDCGGRVGYTGRERGELLDSSAICRNRIHTQTIIILLTCMTLNTLACTMHVMLDNKPPALQCGRIIHSATKHCSLSLKFPIF